MSDVCEAYGTIQGALDAALSRARGDVLSNTLAWPSLKSSSEYMVDVPSTFLSVIASLVTVKV